MIYSKCQRWNLASNSDNSGRTQIARERTLFYTSSHSLFFRYYILGGIIIGTLISGILFFKYKASISLGNNKYNYWKNILLLPKMTPTELCLWGVGNNVGKTEKRSHICHWSETAGGLNESSHCSTMTQQLSYEVTFKSAIVMFVSLSL